MNYHQKDGTGLHKIFLRYRTNSVGNFETKLSSNLLIYPNPVDDKLNLIFDAYEKVIALRLYSLDRRILFICKQQKSIDFSEFSKGVYFLEVTTENTISFHKIIKE